MSGRVVVERDGDVVLVRLARPDAHNAIDPQWVSEFGAAVAEVERSDARAVLLIADGPAFSVGGDLGHFANRGDDLRAALEEMVPPFHLALGRLAEQPRPVVAAVQGPIAGGGLGIAWCADVVLAAPEARFATGFHRLGLSGDGGSSWYLPRLVGLPRARDMLLRGRVLSAAEAAEWGIVGEVVDAERLRDRALAVASELAAGPPYAFARLRELLRTSYGTSLTEHLAAEAAAIVDCAATVDAAEGIRAFVEKRAPQFAEPVRRVYAALGTGDEEALRALLAPDFVARFADGMPEAGGVAEGPDAAVARWWAIGRAYAVRAEPDELTACEGGRVLVAGRYRGRRRADGHPVDAAFMHLWTIRDGRLRELHQVTDTLRWTI